MTARALRARKRRSATTANSSATPSSHSGWSSFPPRISAPAWKKSPPKSPSRWRRSLMAEGRETWISGIGIVSCLGEGLDAHWQGLNAPPPAADATSFAPYIVHRIVPLALDSAGVKGKTELLSRMDMIVAAGGGERDAQVDLNVAAGVDKAAKAEAFVNERLMNDLRPTLFLAQRS